MNGSGMTEQRALPRFSRHTDAVHTTRESQLADVVGAGSVVVLTGAGCSTASGIPDYRGPNGAFTRGHQPMTYQQFLRDPLGRRRYWARSHVGWPRFSRAQPNAAHLALAQFEAAGLVSGVITQNVDGLHQAAGSQKVIDLHGRLDAVACLSCGAREDRDNVYQRMADVNPHLDIASESINPDGDVEIDEAVLDGFVLIGCRECGGDLKPDVVYFGESVPPDRVEQAYAWLENAESLLVAGSSLTVYSGRRFLIAAHKRGIPIAIVNSGSTKSEELATIRIDDDVCDVLTRLVEPFVPVA